MAISLLGICVGLAALVGLTAHAAGEAEGTLQAYLYRLAWLSLAVLGLALVMLAWLVIRYVNFQLGQRHRRKPTRYINFWALAGERFKLPPEDEDSGEEPAGSDEPRDGSP